jgi:hypothetical protein
LFSNKSFNLLRDGIKFSSPVPKIEKIIFLFFSATVRFLFRSWFVFNSLSTIPEGHSIFTCNGIYRKTFYTNPNNPPRASFLMIHIDDYKNFQKSSPFWTLKVSDIEFAKSLIPLDRKITQNQDLPNLKFIQSVYSFWRTVCLNRSADSCLRTIP